MRNCEICRSRLITGRKYCWRHRNYYPTAEQSRKAYNRKMAHDAEKIITPLVFNKFVAWFIVVPLGIALFLAFLLLILGVTFQSITSIIIPEFSLWFITIPSIVISYIITIHFYRK